MLCKWVNYLFMLKENSNDLTPDPRGFMEHYDLFQDWEYENYKH